jgi:hypothetical protein
MDDTEADVAAHRLHEQIDVAQIELLDERGDVVRTLSMSTMSLVAGALRP